MVCCCGLGGCIGLGLVPPEGMLLRPLGAGPRALLEAKDRATVEGKSAFFLFYA